MRAQLLSFLTTATSTATVKTVSELPWNTAGEPLYLKNMKRFYLDKEQKAESVMIAVLPGSNDVMQNATTVRGYFAVDAKNQPAGLDAAVTALLNAKNQVSIGNFGIESDYTTEIQDDVLIYNIEYRINTTP
jgi:hypothetical protein